MPIALIAFDFDPLIRLDGGFTLRWGTLALAVLVALCLLTAGVLARRSGLRPDDLLYIVIGAVPGAVVGGRVGYALVVPDAFGGGLMTLFDPAVGGLELSLAVVGGLVTAWVVASLLGAPPGAWADILAVPLLAAIAGGKLAMALTGSGQGRPFDGALATAYVGAGPWLGAAPGLPSHPSQIYEGIGTLAVAVLVTILTTVGAFRAHDGARMLTGLAGWAVIRAAVSTTWRDPLAVGPLPVGGILAVVIAASTIIVAVAVAAWLPRRTRARNATNPAWPDPETRPPF